MNSVIKKSIKQGKYARVLREVRFFINGEQFPILTLYCDVVHRAGGFYISNSQNWNEFRIEAELKAQEEAFNKIPYACGERSGAQMRAEREFIESHDLPSFTDMELGRGGFGRGNKSEVSSRARASFRDLLKKAETFLRTYSEEGGPA